MEDYGFPVGSRVWIKSFFNAEAEVIGHTTNVLGRPLVEVHEDTGLDEPGGYYSRTVYYPRELELIK